MSDLAIHVDRLAELAGAVCNKIASENEFVELDTILLADQASCSRYLSYCRIHVALRLELRAQQATQNIHEQIHLKSAVPALADSNAVGIETPSAIPHSFLTTAFHPAIGFFPEGMPLAYLIATLVTGLGLLIGSHVYMSRPEQVARQSAPFPSPLSPLPSVVGRITGMVDCKWEKEGLGIRDWGLEKGSGFRVQGSENPTSYIPHPASRVVLGDRFVLSAGLLEITYDTGAKVILQGPVTYEVASNGGYLAMGKLTGKLENRGERRGERGEGDKSEIRNLKSEISAPSPLSPLLSPLFVIHTPSAIVTDLGTEFGIEVTEHQQSRLHVFQGKVVVRTKTPSAEAPRETEMHAGESASVDAKGAVTRRSGPQATAHAIGFVRTIPKRIVKVLSLVDVVAGGDGFGKARDRGIDPAGKTTETQLDLNRAIVSGDGRYHRVAKLPLLDGVFIPRGGREPVELDSAGHSFAGFPSTDNRSWGCIWAGGVIPYCSVDGANDGAVLAVLQGVDYSAPWHSVLFMHANRGITFDLAAIRRASPQNKIVRFVAAAGNPANRGPEDGVGKCDVWVFVDGQPRFRREGMMPYKESKINVGLDDGNRYLSLVVTDGGDGYSWDCVIFGDPRLILVHNPAPGEQGRNVD